jgi:hypothetical protein
LSRLGRGHLTRNTARMAELVIQAEYSDNLLDSKFDIEAAPDLEDEEHDSNVNEILVPKVRFLS